jgi:antirestriction protein
MITAKVWYDTSDHKYEFKSTSFWAIKDYIQALPEDHNGMIISLDYRLGKPRIITFNNLLAVAMAEDQCALDWYLPLAESVGYFIDYERARGTYMGEYDSDEAFAAGVGLKIDTVTALRDAGYVFSIINRYYWNTP